MTQTQPPRSLVVGLLTSVVAVAFEAVAVATAMPAAGRQLGHLGLYAWTFTLFVIGMALSTVLAGRFCDRFGPTRAVQGGLLLFGAGLLVASFAPTMHLLLVARFVQGFGGGAFNVSMMVLVAMLFTPEARAGIMTAFSFCWVMPAFVAPFIAAWLTENLSWHWVFASMLPLVLATAVLTNQPLEDLRDRLAPDGDLDSDPVPIWSAFVAAIGVAAVQLAGQWANHSSIPVLVLGLVCLGVSLPRLMAPGFFRVSAGIPATSWSRALLAGSFFAAEAFLPLSLVTIRGMSLFEAGLTLTVGSLGWTIGSWLQARPWLMLRRDQLVQLGTLLCLTGMGAMTLATALDWSVWVIGVGWTLAGSGMGLSIASGSLIVMALSTAARLGRNTSSLQVAEALGNSLFTGLAGSVYANLRLVHLPRATFAAVFATVLVVTLLAVVVSLRIGPVANPTSGAGESSA